MSYHRSGSSASHIPLSARWRRIVHFGMFTCFFFSHFVSIPSVCLTSTSLTVQSAAARSSSKWCLTRPATRTGQAPRRRPRNRQLGSKLNEPVASHSTTGQKPKGSPRPKVRIRKGVRSSNLQEKFALFIDGDQIGVPALAALIKELEKRGRVVLRRYYGLEHIIKSHSSQLRTLNITPVVVPKHSGGTKDVTDMRIAWEVALLVAGPNDVTKHMGLDCGNFTAVALASNDGDYLEILQQVRTLQKVGIRSYRRYQVAPSLVGLRDAEVLSRWKSRAAEADAEIVLFDVPTQQRARLRIVLHQGKSTMSVEDVEHAHVGADVVADIARTLRRLGYLDGPREGDPMEGMAAIGPAPLAKFFHANDLGPLTIEPLSIAMEQTAKVLQSGKGDVWVSNPGNLVFIEPQGVGSSTKKTLGGTSASATYKGGGPFMLRDSSTLVEEVLQRMGYLDAREPEHHEAAMKCFCDVNTNNLLRRNVDLHRLASVDGHDLLRLLHKLFVADQRQKWRVPKSDNGVRQFLSVRSLLSSKEAPKADVLDAMRSFLSSVGSTEGLATDYYHGVVGSFLRYLNRNDPCLRKP